MSSIVFVCTGNTCRSPMAEAVARAIFAREGLCISVQSAGVAAFKGQAASKNALLAMHARKLDISAHITQPAALDLLKNAALVLTMTRGHLSHVKAACPAANAFTLGEYAGSNAEVSDPFGGDLAEYRACAAQIEALLVSCMSKFREDLMDGMERIIQERLHINTHPLVRSKMTMLRDKETGHKQFRELVDEIAAFLSYEATSNVPLVEKTVETPVATAKGWHCEQKFALIPILRAGLGMVDGISRLLPTAKIGHIGIYRNPETLQPVEYFAKLPTEIAEREILLLDPMIATGGTAEASIRFLKNAGAKKIKLLCLVAVREGVEEVLKNHPDIDIYTAAYDEKLNDHGYIVPGLGDAGDRLFGTK